MVAENRAVQLDLAARAEFAKAGEEVFETRSILSDNLVEKILESPEITEAKNTVKLSAMVDFGWVEVE